MSFSLWLFFGVTVFAAGFTQGLSGFGSILISLPVLSAFIDVKTVIPMVSLYAMAINLINLINNRKYVRYDDLVLLVLGSLPGIAVGVYMLQLFSDKSLKLILGFVLIGFSVYLLTCKISRTGLGRWWSLLAGFLSGCFGGSIAANGPPLILYSAFQPWGKARIKGTLAGFFFFSGIAICFSHWLAGFWTAECLRITAFGIPAMLIGVWAGTLCFGLISEDLYRKGITWFLLFMGGLTVVWQFV